MQTGSVEKPKLWKDSLGEEDQKEIPLVFFFGTSHTLRRCPVGKRFVQDLFVEQANKVCNSLLVHAAVHVTLQSVKWFLNVLVYCVSVCILAVLNE